MKSPKSIFDISTRPYAQKKRRYRPRLLWSQVPGAKPVPFSLILDKSTVLTTLGRYEETSNLLSSYLPLAKNLEDRIWEARFSVSLSHNLNILGRPKEALPHAERARNLFLELNDPRGLAEALQNLSLVYGYLCQAEIRLRYKHELLDLSERYGFSDLCINTIFALRHELGPEETLKKLAAQLDIIRRQNDRKLIALANFYMGDIYMNTGRLREAEACNQEHYRIACEIGDSMGLNYALGDRGLIYLYQGRYHEAIECFSEKLEVAQRSGDFYNTFEAMSNIACAYLQIDDLSSALKYLDQLEHHVRRHDIVEYLPKTLCLKGECLFKQGLYSLAEKVIDEALDVALKHNNLYYLFYCRLLKAKLIALDDKDGGLRMLESMLSEACGDEQLGDLYQNMYHISKKEDHRDLALRCYRQAYQRYRYHYLSEIIHQLEMATTSDEIENR